MENNTHVLSVDLGIDFTKVLSEPNLSGVMLALNIKDEKDVIVAYSNHITEKILASISGREELELLKTEVFSLEIEEQEPPEVYFEEKESAEKDSSWNVTYSSEADQYSKMIELSIEEVGFMHGLELKEIQIKSDVLKSIKNGFNEEEMTIQGVKCVVTDIFDEDDSYEGVPYKLVLVDKNNNETTILGGV